MIEPMLPSVYLDVDTALSIGAGDGAENVLCLIEQGDVGKRWKILEFHASQRVFLFPAFLVPQSMHPHVHYAVISTPVFKPHEHGKERCEQRLWRVRAGT